MEADVATLKNEVSHLRTDLEEVKAIACECQKLLRWGMGAAAGAGSMLTLVAPKVAEALGWG